MSQQKAIFIFISLLTYLNIFTTQTNAEQNTTLKTIKKINIKTTLILTSPIKKNKSLIIKSLIIPELALHIKNAKIKILNDGYKITTEEGTLKTKQIENIFKLEGIIKEFPEELNGTIQWTNATIIKNTNGIEIQINNTEIKNSKLINNLKIGNIKITKKRNEIKLLFNNILSNTLTCKSIIFTKKRTEDKERARLNALDTTIDLEKTRKLASKLFPNKIHTIENLIKKHINCINTKDPGITGKILISKAEISTTKEKENWKIEKTHIALKVTNLIFNDKQKNKIRLSLEGTIKSNGQRYEWNIKKTSIKIKQLAFQKMKLKTIKGLNLHIPYLTGEIDKEKNITIALKLENTSEGKAEIDENNNRKIIKIKKISTIIRAKNNNFIWKDLTLNLEDNNQGLINITSSGKWPLEWDNLRCSAEINNFSYKKYRILKIKAQKNPGNKCFITGTIRGSNYTIDIKNAVMTYQQKELTFKTKKIIYKENKENKNEQIDKKEGREGKKEEHFNFSYLPKIGKVTKSINLIIDELVYNNIIPIENITFKLEITKPKIEFQGKANWCYTTIGLDGEIINKNRIIIENNLMTTQAPLDGILACFLSEAPIYLLGNINANILASTEGTDITEIKNNFSFKGAGEIRGGKIIKISNLHKELRWILDILSMVRLNTSQLKDTIEFNNLIFNIEGDLNKIDIKNLVLLSKTLKMNLQLLGTIKLKPEISKNIKGIISVMGLTKNFEIKDKKETER